MLEQEGYDVMGAAFEVYNTMGAGFLEEVYQQSLEIELRHRGIPFEAQKELALYYKVDRLNKKYVADLVVFGSMILELKALVCLAPEHIAQIINYLKASRLSVGYVINFGAPGKLEWKRVIYTGAERDKT